MNLSASRRRALAACLGATVLLLAACRQDPPSALGTLEYDRIALAAPASVYNGRNLQEAICSWMRTSTAAPA